MTNSPSTSRSSTSSRVGRTVVVGAVNSNAGGTRFSIPRPHSLGKFILFPSLWRLPNFKNLDSLVRRVKTNLLYFQTNYLIVTLACFAIFMILSMKTLLTGVVSAIIIAVAVLFFFEHIPQARQIKQNHPTLVIIAGIVLIIVTWHAFYTILLVVAAALAPLPLCLLHAACRSSNNLIDGTQLTGDYFLNTPVGQIMQMLGLEARPSQME